MGLAKARKKRASRSRKTGARPGSNPGQACSGSCSDAMPDELDNDVVAKAYARWAPIYDFVFGAMFARGRRASIAAAERIGGRILEVGVGTGLSLPDYSRSNRLVGVDLSAPMLRKAKARVLAHKLSNVDGLAVMDAQHLGFADAAFDVVVAQYVITTVPDPETTLDEFVARRQIRRRDRVGEPSRRRAGLARGVRARLRAARPPARLAAGIPLGAARAMGRPPRRRAAGRAPADAAARAFFADPLCEAVVAKLSRGVRLASIRSIARLTNCRAMSLGRNRRRAGQCRWHARRRR